MLIIFTFLMTYFSPEHSVIRKVEGYHANLLQGSESKAQFDRFVISLMENDTITAFETFLTVIEDGTDQVSPEKSINASCPIADSHQDKHLDLHQSST